jgi:ethanolamine utilization protein EutN
MRLGTVIGRVTLSKTIPQFKGGRWLVISPFTREHFQHRHELPVGLSRDPSLVAYDSLGGGVGDSVGFSEGREAAMPFEQPTPVDAITVAIIDDVFYSPQT